MTNSTARSEASPRNGAVPQPPLGEPRPGGAHFWITATLFGIPSQWYRHLFGILIQSCPEGFMDNLAGVVQQLRRERDHAANALKRIDVALTALSGVSGRTSRTTRTRSRLSPAARARIAAAQRARWARVRARSGQKPKVLTMPKKKTISAAGRRRIAAAQRARWARVKAAQKKSA
jgi:hypothetical protein